MERIVRVLDGVWEYRDSTCDTFENVRIPHTMQELPYNCFDERNCQCQGVYRRRLTIPADWKGRRLRVRFEGVMAQASVFLNDQPVGSHSGGYTP